MIHRAILLAALSAALATGCTSDPAVEAAPSSAPVSTVTVTQSSARVSAETITTCRSLAEDPNLREYWRAVAENPGVGPSDLQLLALSAVRQVAKRADDSLIDDDVRSAAVAAGMAAVRMRAEWVRSGTLDVEAFRALITPIVQACEAQRIDMAVPD